MSESDTCELLCLDLRLAEALRQARPDAETLAGVAERAKALADPTRLTVALALLDGGELCVCDLAWVCERSDKLVSHHVRQLRAAGLVRSRRDGKMVIYSLTESGSALVTAVTRSSAGASSSLRAGSRVDLETDECPEEHCCAP
jgi:ArsR family transcriptional regulator, lead/cadmium/zinc/bismuth-responsive transcriptional repressor